MKLPDHLYPVQRLVITKILEADKSWKNNHSSPPSAFIAPGESFADITDSGDTARQRIIILPTGAGKSLCFSWPAPFLEGPTLVIYPLRTLVNDQFRRLQNLPDTSPPEMLVGGMGKTERERIFNRIESRESFMLLATPEAALLHLDKLKNKIAHLVFDEAHCISQWGKSFRPAYRDVDRLQQECRPKQTSAFTATASPPVLNDIKELLFQGKAEVLQLPGDRENIHYSLIPTSSKMQSLITILRKDIGPALVFCNNRELCSIIAYRLSQELNRGDIDYYHAGLAGDVKERKEEAFLNNRIGILVATCAYGMGIDKSNIRQVIHYTLPDSVEAYLQESGRAGRDKNLSKAIILVSPKDRRNALIQVLSGGTCIRKSLLHAMDEVLENCMGCDMCDNSRQSHSFGILEIHWCIKWYNGRYSRNELLQFLQGTIKSSLPGASWLTNYSRFTINEILESMFADRKMRLSPFPWNKNKLYKGRNFNLQNV